MNTEKNIPFLEDIWNILDSQNDILLRIATSLEALVDREERKVDIGIPVIEQMKTEEPKAEEPKAEQAKTLDDVRAAVTQVMKADKTKKQALQALLKKHGADRVSELDESKFAIVIDTIEKGEF
jgi:hypothetical protein